MVRQSHKGIKKASPSAGEWPVQNAVYQPSFSASRGLANGIEQESFAINKYNARLRVLLYGAQTDFTKKQLHKRKTTQQ